VMTSAIPGVPRSHHADSSQPIYTDTPACWGL
jgi:hypothetical protein